MSRRQLRQARRLIIKVGSSLLTAAGSRLNVDYINQLSAQVARARGDGNEIVIVSSGSVAAGMQRLEWHKRPQTRVDAQVTAAVGQMRLINAYAAAFAAHQLHAAQVLLTAEDMAHRTLYLNARATLKRMLEMSIVPVINENDVIATDKVSFGDNDHLAAQIANLLEADALLIFTDAPGLCRNTGDMSDVIPQAAAADDSLLAHVAESGGGVGVGGMKSKLRAAQIAARSGAHTLIADGRVADCLARALSGDDNYGTLLVADTPRLSARKQWLASGLHVRGRMILDAGAAAAVVNDKRSLLPAGVAAVYGDFIRGDAVALMDDSQQPLGYALSNYNSNDARRLCGVKSDKIAAVLGYMHEEEMAHRDNMTILK